MKKEYFIASNKINARIRETIIPGYHIVVEGRTFEQCSKLPLGRSKLKKLVNLDQTLALHIYG